MNLHIVGMQFDAFLDIKQKVDLGNSFTKFIFKPSLAILQKFVYICAYLRILIYEKNIEILWIKIALMLVTFRKSALQWKSHVPIEITNSIDPKKKLMYRKTYKDTMINWALNKLLNKYCPDIIALKYRNRLIKIYKKLFLIKLIPKRISYNNFLFLQ